MEDFSTDIFNPVLALERRLLHLALSAVRFQGVALTLFFLLSSVVRWTRLLSDETTRPDNKGFWDFGTKVAADLRINIMMMTPRV